QRDGSNDRLLAEGEGYAWSPDSRQIAFIRAGNVYVVNSDGSGEEQVIDSPLPLASAPNWAPDGRILFSYGKDSAETRLVAPDGTERTALVPGGAPVWSNDGLRIAFSASVVNLSGGTVYLTAKDGSDIVPLPASVYATDACVTALGCQP